jgi:hypothetical protein
MTAGSANDEVLGQVRTARFKKPGSCSAVKLKCIRPIPINTTANRSIVHVIRDRIRLSSAQVTSRGAQISSLQLNNRTREYKLLTHFAGSDVSAWIVHSA